MTEHPPKNRVLLHPPPLRIQYSIASSHHSTHWTTDRVRTAMFKIRMPLPWSKNKCCSTMNRPMRLPTTSLLLSITQLRKNRQPTIVPRTTTKPTPTPTRSIISKQATIKIDPKHQFNLWTKATTTQSILQSPTTTTAKTTNKPHDHEPPPCPASIVTSPNTSNPPTPSSIPRVENRSPNNATPKHPRCCSKAHDPSPRPI
mmetsp:Transcript_5217/g.9570  ORF Transcript_5217/g.9570 Transcript_5217/m.9570 type:complete len:201 (+) Transcript_5217:267-869(+)